MKAAVIAFTAGLLGWVALIALGVHVVNTKLPGLALWLERIGR